jgi:hypothetical protein
LAALEGIEFRGMVGVLGFQAMSLEELVFEYKYKIGLEIMAVIYQPHVS